MLSTPPGRLYHRRNELQSIPRNRINRFLRTDRISYIPLINFSQKNEIVFGEYVSNDIVLTHESETEACCWFPSTWRSFPRV